MHPLRQWRHEHRISLATLAQRVKTTPATLSRVETDQQRPSYKLVMSLVELTGLTFKDLIDRRLNPPAA